MPTIETSIIEIGAHMVECDLKMAQQNLRVWIPTDEHDNNVLIEMCSETGGIWQLIGSYDGKNPPAKIGSGHLRIYDVDPRTGMVLPTATTNIITTTVSNTRWLR
jgi:hypothetical protein